jgi:DNA polymerase
MPDGAQFGGLATAGPQALDELLSTAAVIPTFLYVDIETRSAVNLLSQGVYVYAEHPSTAIILLSYALDDGPLKTWFILRGDPMPDDLRQAILCPSTIFVAHNAGFERVVLTVVGGASMDAECHRALKDVRRWTCTAARSAVLGLPRSLENVGKALGLAIQKDHEGYNLMMLMCRPLGLAPGGGYIWREDIPSQERLARYCEVDVAVERLINLDLPPLSDFEQEVWRTTERMNDRGISVDEKLLHKLVLFAGEAESAASAAMRRLTEGAVPAVTNTIKLRDWLVSKGLEEAEELNEQGKPKGVGKWMIQKWLDDGSLPPLLREVLTVRKEGGKSSTKKFIAIANRLNLDFRIRGSLLYCGAASTTRFSSRGAQLHNLPRGGTVKNMIAAINDVLDDIGIEDVRVHGPPLVVASEMARPVFVAAIHHWLARGDYSQIEARVNAWLAGELWKIRAFRDFDTILGYDEKGKPIRKGPDLYTAGAAASLGIRAEEVTPIQRQGSGKVGELACGFGGGVGALLAMARVYNVNMSEEAAEATKQRWRAANPNIVQFWYDLDNAAVACMRGAIGDKFMVRPGLWFKRNRRALALRLPSGGTLIYWYPKLEEVMTPWGKLKWTVTYMAEDSQKHIWVRHKGYGGLFCENVCQKLARDIMADAMVRMDAKGLDPRLTVHDEVVCQISWLVAPTAAEAAELVEREMLIAPSWCPGLPIAVETSAAQRYLKAA